MAHKCPACSAEVPDVVLVTKMLERVNAKSTEIGLLKEELSTKADKAGRYDVAEAERGRLALQVSMLQEGTTRRDALLGVGVQDPKIVSGFNALYASYAAGVEEGTDAETFPAWLASEVGAKANPLLSPHFKAVTGEGEGAGNTAPANGAAAVGAPGGFAAAPAGGMPKPNAGAVPGAPAGQKLMNAQQLRVMFQGMTPAQVQAWQAQHGSTYGWAAPVALAKTDT